MDNTTLFFYIFNLSRQNPILDILMIFGAQYLIFLTFIWVIYLASSKTIVERKAFFTICLGLLIMHLIIQLIRLIFLEPRPFVTNQIIPLIKHDSDASFPSIHTSLMAIIAFSFWLIQSKYSPLLINFMLWVGFARIFVGVHYPQDILAGILVGFVSVISAKQLLLWLKIKLV